MKSYSKKLPATKTHPNRLCNWTPSPEGGGMLEILGHKARDHYRVAEFPCHNDFDGRAFSVRKDDGEAYDVLISNRRAEWDSCDCAGFTYQNVCKHQQSLRSILESGWMGASKPGSHDGYSQPFENPSARLSPEEEAEYESAFALEQRILALLGKAA